jgi:hypothetical protein
MKKQAIVTKEVPACLSPTGETLPIGTIIDYWQARFRNGEWHYVIRNEKTTEKTTTPCIFYDDLEEVEA